VFQERNKLSLLLGSKLLPTKLRSPKNILNDDLTAVVIETPLEVVEKEWGTFTSAAHSKSGVVHYKASMPFNVPLGDICVLVHASPKKSGAAYALRFEFNPRPLSGPGIAFPNLL
jgi:hypothetical protein